MFTPSNRLRVQLDCGDKLITKQAPKAECDINNILKQYRKTGIFTHINQNASQGMYVDLPSEVDLQQSFRIVAEAQEAFSSLPAKTRDRFGNDPLQFLAAFNDPSLAAELRELGLLQPDQSLPVAAPPPPSGPGSVPVPGTGPIGADGKDRL